MAQQVKALAGFSEDPCLAPSTHIRDSQPSVTPSLGNPTPLISADTLTLAQRHADTLIYTQLKIKNTALKNATVIYNKISSDFNYSLSILEFLPN